jgi:luciferase family oxidoreductase group 1
LATTLKLGVLDQAPVPEGSTASQALDNSVELARHVEALGYTRFWMSEHHAMQTLACSAPEVVLARVGAATRSIRIGSGGVMLPHYAPMKIAEVFRTLHAMYPNRVDLGVGRAPGGGPIETLALQRDRGLASLRSGADDFPEQMAELLAWLGQSDGFPSGHRFGTIHLSPDIPGGPTVWMLGSSLWGAHAAAQWGLPYAFAHFFSPVATREAIESYRHAFRPSALLAKPKAVIAVGVIVAPTDEEARFLHSSVRLLQVRIRQGDRRPVASPEDALRELEREGNGLPVAPAGALEEGEFPRYLVGSPEIVKRDLGRMAASLGLDEVLVNTITYSHEARLRSYALLAQTFATDRRVAEEAAQGALAS